MCRHLGIARAAFYKWKHRIIPQQERENQEIAELIKEYDERFFHILGYRRMTDWINHFNQTHFSRKRIHRIMKKLGIHSVIRKKKKKYNTSKPEETAENKLARDFYAAAPNQKWATDVTEFKIPETGKKLYPVSYTHLRLSAPVFILSDPLLFNLRTDNPNHTLLPGIIFQKFPFYLKPFFFFFPHILLFLPCFLYTLRQILLSHTCLLYTSRCV